MTYLLDGRALQDRSSMRGIGTYARGLLQGFHDVGVADQIELLLRKDLPEPPAALTHGARISKDHLLATKRRIQPLVDPFTVSLALRRTQPSLYHGLEYAQPLSAKCPVVITVHDLIPFVTDAYPWLRRERVLALRLLRRADALIADSRWTADDLIRVAKARPERIHVVPLGVSQNAHSAQKDDVRALRTKHGLRRPYILTVGSFDPRKRIGDTVKVVAALRRDHDLDVVIVGDQGKFAKPVADAIRSAGLDANAHVLGYVPGPDLAALYAGCACLLFTSSYEGFGLPPLEAMQAGAPVAMYGNSSLTEVAGDAAMVAPDGDSVALVHAISALLSDDAERRQRVAAGKNWASSFTWEQTARQTLDVYEHVLAKPS